MVSIIPYPYDLYGIFRFYMADFVGLNPSRCAARIEGIERPKSLGGSPPLRSLPSIKSDRFITYAPLCFDLGRGLHTDCMRFR